jgi:hypothetical protein
MFILSCYCLLPADILLFTPVSSVVIPASIQGPGFSFLILPSVLRLKVSGLRSQVSALSPQISGFRSQPSALRFQVSALSPQISGFRFQVSALSNF